MERRMTLLLDTHVVHWWSAEPERLNAASALPSPAPSLPSSFPGDPADRLIYATAVEYGWQCVTKDRRLRDHPDPREVTVW
jgi:PIN domain nuclease of toxin-antitoxin system